jgi:hypothetical protein
LLKTLGEERRWCVDQKTENPFGRPITKQQTFQYVDSREAKTLSVAASDDNSETGAGWSHKYPAVYRGYRSKLWIESNMVKNDNV